MRQLTKLSTRAVTFLLAVWIAASGTALSVWLAAEARGFAHAFAAAGESLGATSMEIEVDLLGAWPQLAPVYAVVVVLPAAAFWLLWKRAPRAVAAPAATMS